MFAETRSFLTNLKCTCIIFINIFTPHDSHLSKIFRKPIEIVPNPSFWSFTWHEALYSVIMRMSHNFKLVRNNINYGVLGRGRSTGRRHISFKWSFSLRSYYFGWMSRLISLVWVQSRGAWKRKKKTKWKKIFSYPLPKALHLFYAFQALIAGELGQCIWHQAWHSSAVMGA